MTLDRWGRAALPGTVLLLFVLLTLAPLRAPYLRDALPLLPALAVFQFSLATPERLPGPLLLALGILLDLLLGVSMDKVLESMHLPEPINDALIGGTGAYAAFLDLARATEAGDGADLAQQAGMLGLAAHQVNTALLEALAFAEKLEF